MRVLVFFIPLVGGSTLRELAAGRVYMGAAISPNYFLEANYSDVSSNERGCNCVTVRVADIASCAVSAARLL